MSTTTKINVLVLATGATLELFETDDVDPEVKSEDSIELETIDENTDFGCDPLNSADRLRPNARYFLDTKREEKSAAVSTQVGIDLVSLKWLATFSQTED